VARGSSLCVRIEKPEGAFGEVMNEIRSLLDSGKYSPNRLRIRQHMMSVLRGSTRPVQQAFSTRLITSGNPTAGENTWQNMQPSRHLR
jgi:hypothetical protein